MPTISGKYVSYAVGLAFAGLTVYLGYFIRRADFLPFISAYGAFFGLYLWLVFFRKNMPPAEARWYTGLGIGLRILLLFSIPNLSDDFYRFLWDGHLIVAGISPFSHPPTYFIENQIFPKGITPELFGKLNSPEYFTVYPPVCQAVFALSAWLSPENEWSLAVGKPLASEGIVVMKLFLLACEVGTIWLLGVSPPRPPRGGEDVALLPGREGDESDSLISSQNSQGKEGRFYSSLIQGNQGSNALPPSVGAGGAFLPEGERDKSDSLISPQNSHGKENRFYSGLIQRNRGSDALPPSGGLGGAAYALNPLVILEITGNCHFEGAMIFFLIAGIRALEKNKVKPAAGCWALATASKLLPLMFLPIVWRRLGWHKGLVFNAVFAGVCLILFAPLLSVLPNILSSLDLYFRQFQFNASAYYLIRGIGFLIVDYDIGEVLGPFLGLMTVAGVLIITWMLKPSRYSKPGRLAFDFTEALLFALLLQLSLSATVHPWYVTVPFAISLLTAWRFPVIWTGLAALSYSHYASGRFQENYWFVALEYSILWLFIIWETKQRKP